ncbi:MAG: hypothetical protein QM706_03600 [Nitrospira sp.]
MAYSGEHEWIEANVDVIRIYLKNKFLHYTLKEVSGLNEYHMFIVTNVELYESYKLKVSGHRLSDPEHTPAKTRAELDHDDVARKMIEANGDYFYWE